MSRFRPPHPVFHPAEAGSTAEALPEWDLSALYASPDDPAIERDVEAAANAARDLAGRAKGRLEAILKAPDGAAMPEGPESSDVENEKGIKISGQNKGQTEETLAWEFVMFLPLKKPIAID